MKVGLQKFVGIFQCKRCTGGSADVITDEYCVIDGVGRVASFEYLGDELDSGGGCLSAVTARVCVGWRKFRELSGVLCGQR